MITYILSLIFAAFVLLIAAVISNSIVYEGGVNPKDPGKRKMWFWILAVLNPIFFYVIAEFVMKPQKVAEAKAWSAALPLATIAGFIIYIILGFVVSKIFKNGKLGNWF